MSSADPAPILYGFHRSTKVGRALKVLEATLRDHAFVVGNTVTLADYFLLSTLIALGFTSEGTQLRAGSPHIRGWLDRMGAREEVIAFRATLPPRTPIEHARRWATEHRPGVRHASEPGGGLGIGG